jgi:hypothetical protein
MHTVEVPRKDWGQALDEFSAVHEGWLVSLDLLAPTLGAQRQIRDMPLRGITADTDSHGTAITIAAARSDGEHITHIIHSPTHIRIERTDDNADVALQIESAEGIAAILRLKTVALPETVDGVLRP